MASPCLPSRPLPENKGPLILLAPRGSQTNPGLWDLAIIREHPGCWATQRPPHRLPGQSVVGASVPGPLQVLRELEVGGVGGERGWPSPRAREPLPEEALSFPGAHCVAQAHLGSPQRRHSTQMPEEEGGLARHGGNSVRVLKFAAQGSCSAGERVEGCLLAGDLSPAPGVAKLLIPPGA